MSIAPHTGIVDFGTFTAPTASKDGIQGEVPMPLAGQEAYVLTATGWAPGGGGGGSGTVTQINTGTGLTGGPITTTGTVALANTAVSPGAYTNANITVDQQGRITLAANGSATSGVSSFSGGSTGLTPSTATTGAITLAGTLALGYGGTGVTTAQSAMNTFAGAVTSGSYLRGNGTNVVMSTIQAADVPTLNQNTTGSAATLTTGRTIAITGDLAYTSPSFDGSSNITAAGTLATVNTNVGSFTNASFTVNGKGLITAASSGTAPVTSVTATSPVASTGGTTPVISMPAATASVSGYLTSTDWTTFNNKGSGTVTSVGGTGTVSGISLSGTVTSSGNLTLGGSLDLSSPPAIGGTTASTGRFTTITSTATTGTAPFTVASTTQVANLNAATAGSAATLTTARSIYGSSFNGSADLSGVIASTYGGTGNGFTKFSGATTAEKTYTLPDATTTILTTNTAVTPAQGGTGQTTYTDGQLLIGNSTGNTLTKATLTAGTGITITNGGGSISIAASGGGSGTVTSVGWTGGIVSVGTPTTTPAFTIAGTSGGIPYFSSGTTWASSGALTANAIVLGGGAGVAPTVLGSLGTTSTVLHGNASGAPSFGAVSLTTDVSGILPPANGGTGIANNAAATVTSSGNFAYTRTLTGTTNVTFPTSGTLLSTAAVITPAQGGTGVANNASSTLTISGAFGTTLTVSGTTAITLPTSGTLSTWAGTETLTNKRIDPRVSSVASASSLTPTIASADVYAYTALAANLTINAPTGTPVDGDKLIFRILDNGTARTLTWNTTYTAIGVTLPTTTTANKTTYVGCIYNAYGASGTGRWDVIAVTTQA